MTELTDPSDYATILASSNPNTLLIYRSPDPSYSLSDNSDPSSSSSSSSSSLTPQENPAMSIPANLLKGLRPDTFNGCYRDNRTKDWLVRFKQYCRLANIAETGQDHVLYAGMLMTDSASQWYEQLGTITKATIDGRTLSPYQVFKNKFRQCFMNTNDAKDAFDQIRDLCQKQSVNEYVTAFERFQSCLNDFTDKDAIRFFHGGLKPELHQLVDNHPDIANDDINGLIALAERLDKMNKSK